jgi:RHH-type proline utilization regulon transcriptional repressor/proline dehydrogenase/delta 1-pyrroline-5-carboxylate dehydrogenase
MPTHLPDKRKIRRLLFADETAGVRELAKLAKLTPHERAKVHELASALVSDVRANRSMQGGIDAFMQEYALSSEEGIVLMCLAEALLRIPDAETADRLIADKLADRDWERHMGQSESVFVNATAWGLMLTGRFVELGRDTKTDITSYVAGLVKRSGEPVIRQAMRQAMRIMGKQFVLGRTIEEALAAAKPLEAQGYRFSYDMLGEAAMTRTDAERYFRAYADALAEVARAAGTGRTRDGVFGRVSLSLKLSALHPRYEEKARSRMSCELAPRLLELAGQAKAANIGLTIDAEEANRLELSLDLLGELAHDSSLAGWNGLGLAVQAYSKRAYPVLEWLRQLAEDTNRVFPVRLVKGAYWDTEIKRSQEGGYDGYPVFTRKVSTDVSYLAGARYLMGNRDRFFPQFATHNAHTLAAVTVMAGGDDRYELQRLHGMGQPLYASAASTGAARRIYAPVGSHEDLLAYLVRRLLENGANSSFVNRLADDASPIEDIIADPVEEIASLSRIPHPRIPAPGDIYAPRRNSTGLPLWDEATRAGIEAGIAAARAESYTAAAIVSGKPIASGKPTAITAPHNHNALVGEVHEAREREIDQALTAAHAAYLSWDGLGAEQRASILERAADLYENNRARLMMLLIYEAGKTLDNAQADLREAVDFLRYYAAQARADFVTAMKLPGPTGESNQLSLHARGIFACISPWNFPLAIFTGQISAALAAGNAVIAKPAEQTPLVAAEALRLLHRAGVPPEALHLLPGDGARIGKILLADPRISGVAFTGSNETAERINRALSGRSGPIVPFIAETGGMNAMIVDSSALPEQAVRDAIASAFDSAGQRCSAARILFIQEDIAEGMIAMLKGAMAELKLGDPGQYETDVGPVIDAEAKTALDKHKAKMAKIARIVLDVPLDRSHEGGTFVGPATYEIADLKILDREIFGPILHVIRFAGDRMSQVCEALNATGYGLTLGLHTRIESTVEEVRACVRVGNMYVNRNQIGAVVGVQPFGGEGLSGTGPKAGGPHYLHRFATERVLSIDTTAAGGNAALMSMEPARN